MRMTSTRARGESAFTIVEVLIAAMIVTMVFAGATYFVIGSGKSQQRTMVRQKMAAAADDISQRVRADQNWLKAKPSCKTSGCDVSSQFQPTPAKPDDPKFIAGVQIRPIDGEGDGVGPNDDDHVTPDFYRIEIRISMSAAEQRKWADGPVKTFETVSTVDATALGRAVGSIIVQTCEVVNQVDERMSIAACEGGSGTQRPMLAQPAPCESPFPLSWTQWMVRRPVLPLGCNGAFDAADTKAPYMTSVHSRGVTNVPFKLVRDNSDGGPRTVRSSGDAEKVSGNGSYVFSGLPAGMYTVVPTIGGSREPWNTHMIPSAGRASVQANQEARALIMVRPKQGLGTYGARFTRTVYLYRLETYSTSESEEMTDGMMTVRVTTTYKYMVAKGPRKERWDGPAWTGILAMEPKPFDRYRDNSASVTQPAIKVSWDDRQAPNDGWQVFTSLPTGLHSLPKQQPKPIPDPDDFWGSFGPRQQQCNAGVTPGGSCGNFAWLDHRPGKIGKADSTVSFHSEDGECYLQSSMAPFIIPRRLQNGGGHADRCDRTLVYRNPETGKVTRIPGFLPDKNGKNGGRMLIGMSTTSACIAGCTYASGGGTVDSGVVDPGPGNVQRADDPPVRASNPNPPQVVNKPPPETGVASGPMPASGQAVPSAGGSGGGSPPSLASLLSPPG